MPNPLVWLMPGSGPDIWYYDKDALEQHGSAEVTTVGDQTTLKFTPRPDPGDTKARHFVITTKLDVRTGKPPGAV